MKKFYPFFIDLSGRKIVVIGGGEASYKRVKSFLDSGARVTVLSLEFHDQLLDINSDDLELVKVRLPEELDIAYRYFSDAFMIVIAIDDDEIVDRIIEYAKERNILINNMVHSEKGDVIVPFHGEAGGISIALTSFGVSGLATRVALEKVVKILEDDVEVKAILKVYGRLKKIIRSRVDDHKLRMKLYRELSEDSKFRELLRSGDIKEAFKHGLDILRKYNIPLQPSDERFLDGTE